VIVSTDAVVLHAMKYGESSKIVTLYTRKYGKLKVIAKGVRTAKNKVGASLEPMTIASAVFYKKQNRELSLLSKCEIGTPLKNIFAVEEKMAAGLALIELLSMTMHDEHEDEPLYCSVVETLCEIDRAEKNPVNILIAFMMSFIHRLGLSLRLEHCVHCATRMDETVGGARFQLSEGTVVCAGCAATSAHSGMPLSLGSLKAMLYMLRVPLPQATGVTLSTAARDEVLEVLQAFTRYHIPGMKPLRSLSLFYR
jgi:DNA repair protein RecO (recombination protein O)